MQNQATQVNSGPDVSPGNTGGSSAASSTPELKKFSTFGGVFTPSILTIFGVIMYMRAGFVVGHAGVYQALIILAVAKAITSLTGLSIAAIATNTEVKGGGAYYLISRTLGPEFGGTIGIALFLAQALSVPFYVLGFTESVTRTLVGLGVSQPSVAIVFPIVAFSTAIGVFILTFKSADLAIKAQYVIMGILGISILAFLGGAALDFKPEILRANWTPFGGSEFSFWQLFAIYFPAVTGIMAGVNMSGDLKNPGRSIPLGTLTAIGVALIVYAAQVVLCGGAISREELMARPYQSLLGVAPFHTGFLVTAGVFCATLSSAIGSLLGAPRVLQSLAADQIVKPVRPFAALSRNGEPRRALWLTFAITLVVLYFARNGAEGGALNVVASVVTMLFLWTYGITNLAAFVESFSRNPSFRPRFKLFHWFPALVGAIASLGVSFLIDAPAALAAVAFVVALFLYVRKFILTTSFGDARRGFYYSRTRDNLLTLAQLPVHPKNWRPTIVVFSGNPDSRLTLVRYADWLASGRGIITLAGILQGNLHAMIDQRQAYADSLQAFVKKNRIKAFTDVLVTPDFDLGVNHFLQCTSIGPIKPNLALFGWSANQARAVNFARSLQTATILGMSLVLVHDSGLPDSHVRRRYVDIWWRGQDNGSLMVILGYLLSLNAEWSGSRLRILRVVREMSMREAAEQELSKLIEVARLNVKIEVLCSQSHFAELLHATSENSTAVFLGFEPPDEASAPEFQKSVSSLLSGLPTTLLVHSTGEADLTS